MTTAGCFSCLLPPSILLGGQGGHNVHAAEEYRRMAIKTRRMAEWVMDAKEREVVLQIAAEWDRLAEEKARRKSVRPDQNSD
jgi:hypothetical protein